MANGVESVVTARRYSGLMRATASINGTAPGKRAELPARLLDSGAG